jgi:hypothetical protein
MKFSTAAIVAALAATAHGFSLTMSSIGYLENLGKSGSGLTSFAPSSGSSYSYGAPAPAPASYSYGGAPAPAPAPASYSYGGGAPAPAPYKSSFADMPANSNVNYISTIGGGSKMKSGKNYAGVSRSFRPSTGGFGQSSYLDGIKGKTMQSSSYSSTPSYGSSSSYSYGQPAAPAPAPYSSSYSYGGSAAPAPAPQSSYSYGGSAAPAPAPANGSYLDNLSAAGGSARGAAQSSSYSGMRSTFSKSAQPMASATGSYLSQL